LSDGSIPVAAEFVAVFVNGANLDAGPRSLLVVVASFIIALHLPITTDRAVIHIVFVHDPALAHASYAVAIALLRPPVTTDLDILG